VISNNTPLHIDVALCLTRPMADSTLSFEPDSVDVLERGTYLQVETRGQATRCAIARAAFLDCLLRDDEVVSQLVEHFNEVTGAPAIIDELTANFRAVWELAEKQGLMAPDGMPGAHTADDLTREERALSRPLVRRQKLLSTRLFNIVTGKHAEQTRALILTAARWTHSTGTYWPWLVSNLVHWYREKVLYQNPHGGWRGTLRREPDDWKLSVADDLDLLPDLVIRRTSDENAAAYRKRAREECTAFLRSLQDEWPDGNVPAETQTIERKVGWLYDHRLRGVSISALSKDFADRYKNMAPDYRIALIDGRRKDVRQGIRDAEAWLAESGPTFASLPPVTQVAG
jgi:hypothetical protein